MTTSWLWWPHSSGCVKLFSFSYTVIQYNTLRSFAPPPLCIRKCHLLTPSRHSSGPNSKPLVFGCTGTLLCRIYLWQAASTTNHKRTNGEYNGMHRQDKPSQAKTRGGGGGLCLHGGQVPEPEPAAATESGNGASERLTEQGK